MSKPIFTAVLAVGLASVLIARGQPADEEKKNARDTGAAPQPPPAKADGEPKIPAKDYAQTYSQSFKGKSAMPTGWDFTGPGAEQCVQFEPAGLRITLPSGWDGSRPSTGVRTLFGVKGDFEITTSFEVLSEPRQVDAGKGGTRLSLSVFKDTPHKSSPNSEVATITRSPGGLATWVRLWDERAEKSVPRTLKSFPMTPKTGRLRLVRSGPDLYYCSAEDANEDFTLRTKSRFGAEDLQLIQLIGSTGGEKASLDVRFSDFRIRADGIPDMPAGDVAAAPTPTPVAPAPSPPTTGGSGWVIAALAIGFAFILLLSALALGTWFLLGNRKGFAAFACPNCARILKTPADLAGKKVKCASCNAVVLLPAAEPKP